MATPTIEQNFCPYSTIQIIDLEFQDWVRQKLSGTGVGCRGIGHPPGTISGVMENELFVDIPRARVRGGFLCTNYWRRLRKDDYDCAQ